MSWLSKAIKSASATLDNLNNATSSLTTSAVPDASMLTLFVADCARRQSHFELLKAMLEGSAPVFNVVIVDEGEDLAELLGTEETAARVQLWYAASLSLGRILASTQQTSSGSTSPLNMPPIDVLLRALCQLFAEIEHASGDTIIPDALLALGGLAASAAASSNAPPSGGFYPESVRLRPDEPIRTTLHTAKGAVVYEALIPPSSLPLPFPAGQLSYRDVALGLLEALSAIFGRLKTAKGLAYPASIPSNLGDAFAKLDKRLMKQVVRPLCEDLARAASVVLQKRLRGNDGCGYYPKAAIVANAEDDGAASRHPLFVELSAKSARMLKEATQLASSPSSAALGGHTAAAPASAPEEAEHEGGTRSASLPAPSSSVLAASV